MISRVWTESKHTSIQDLAMAKCEGMSHHISLLPELRRKLESRIEPDDQPQSNAAALEQHLARVRAATAEVVHKSRKSEGGNAVEGITLTVLGGVPLPSAQHGAATGCTGWTIDKYVVCAAVFVSCT